MIDPRFQGVNRHFVFSFEYSTDRTVHTKYHLLTVEIKDYNVIIDGQTFFDQPVRNNLRTYDNIWKIATGQGDDYTTGRLLDYKYFNEYYKMIATDLSKQRAVYVDPKAIQQINFTGNLICKNNEGQDINDNARMLSIIDEPKETILDFSQGTVEVL